MPASNVTPLVPAQVDPVESIGVEALRQLGLDPRHPATWVLAQVARQYDLDPKMKEVEVIRTANGLEIYITKNGMLKYAHRSGDLDGIRVTELRETDNGWGCRVKVWRKSAKHSFEGRGGCGKQEHQAKQGHGPEMAEARALRRALILAFGLPDHAEVYGDPVQPDPPAPSETTDHGPRSSVLAAATDSGSGVPPTREGGADSADIEPKQAGTPDPGIILTGDEQRAMALVASRTRTSEFGRLRDTERQKLDRFLGDVAEGVASIEQIDEHRWQVTGPGAGGHIWVYYVDLERSTVDSAPIEPEAGE